MNNLRWIYLVLVGSIILLVVNIYRLDFYNLKNQIYWGIASNLFVIIAMLLNIKNIKKHKKT